MTTHGYFTRETATFVDTRDLVLHPSAARTANGNGELVENGPRRVASLALVVSARSGTTPTLDARIETSNDGSTWYTAGTFPQVNAVGTTRRMFLLDRLVRAAWDIGGTTPSFTFDLRGELVGG